ncbi:Reep5 [Scenedesmus sp. PABB004]|nr:Reep5 [Scenedesmus sp. PABB004]
MAIAATVSLVYSLVYTTLAYVLPGYQTFKALEKKGADDVREWATYWVVLATFYCLQIFVDLVLSWLPFYYVAKLGFILALWHPSTQLAASLYAKVLSPLVATYEADIDRFVMDARAKGSDLVGQHASTLKTQARQLSGQASVMLKNIQQKAMDRAKAARGPSADAAAGHGLHTE